ncbi:MAG: glutaredoxin domain-containing protein [Enhygromyxa sp.]
MSEAIEIFHYPKCSTCRKALKWLDERGIAHTRVDIVEHPPSAANLSKAIKLAEVGAELPRRRLERQARDDQLIKRPLVLGRELALIGFDPEQWAARLG